MHGGGGVDARRCKVARVAHRLHGAALVGDLLHLQVPWGVSATILQPALHFLADLDMTC